MECKKTLARELTSIFYDQEQANLEEEAFSKVFSRGEDPDEMPEFSISNIQASCPTLLNLLHESQKFESKGQIRRLFSQGAIKLDGERINDPDYDLSKISNKSGILKAGKKFFMRIAP